MKVPINSVYTLMIERYDWIFNNDTNDPGNPLYSKFNASQSSLTSLDSVSTLNSMMPQYGSVEDKEHIDFVEENVVKRSKSVRNKLKGRSRNRLGMGSGTSFDTDYDSEKETVSLNNLAERKMKLTGPRRVNKLKMMHHSQSYDEEIDVDVKSTEATANSPMSSLAVQKENGLSVSFDGIFEMIDTFDNDGVNEN